jgi:hypothetical protein
MLPVSCRVVDELVRSGLLSALANLADLDMGEVSSKLMPLKDEVVMVLVREEEIGEQTISSMLLVLCICQLRRALSLCQK